MAVGYGGDAGGDVGRASVAGDMVLRGALHHREPVDDIDRIPKRGPRPTARAQWDEVHGCLVEWDDDDQLWVHVDPPGRRTAGIRLQL